MKTLITFIISLAALVSPVQNDQKTGRIEMLDTLFATLEQQIPNPAWLEADAYRTFNEKLYSDEVLAMDEEAFLEFFDQERHKLPFSHFQLHRKGKTQGETQKIEPVTWTALDANTAYMKVSTFVTDASPMISAVQEIGTDTYENLIIDLRSNTGGSLDAPVVLGQFLTNKPIDAGVYLTRKWFDENHRSATPEDIAGFPYLRDFTFQGIKKMFREEAAFRMVLPAHDRPVYKGKVYVLVDDQTASACEPLIDRFKQAGIATLVGSTSNGSMLSGASFRINEDYTAFLPIADYQTAEGYRIDQAGVTPDIRVDPEEALDYVLENLIQKSN